MQPARPYDVVLTRRSQGAIEALSDVQRSRILGAIKGLAQKSVVKGAARSAYDRQSRDGRVLFEIRLGLLSIVFYLADYRVVTIVDVVKTDPPRKRARKLAS